MQWDKYKPEYLTINEDSQHDFCRNVNTKSINVIKMSVNPDGASDHS